MNINNLLGNIGIVSADISNNNYFEMNGEEEDSIGFFNWIKILKGRHYNYNKLLNDASVLSANCKMLICSGNPAFFMQMIQLSQKLKDTDIVLGFLPEGDISLYDQYGINSFSKTIYDAINSCDVIMSFEEDKISYYNAISNTPSIFVHVPIDEAMASGIFRINVEKKNNAILVYGDNNPNCPVTVFACAKKLNKPIITIQIDSKKVSDLKGLFNVDVCSEHHKQGQYPFLRLLGKSYLHIYPTRWIGSAREPIACAVAGTPCIGSNRSHTQKRLWPELTFDIYDIEGMVKKGNQLYDDKEYYQSVCSYAWKEVSFYNMENTTNRFLQAYQIGLENKRRKKNV